MMQSFILLTSILMASAFVPLLVQRSSTEGLKRNMVTQPSDLAGTVVEGAPMSPRDLSLGRASKISKVGVSFLGSVMLAAARASAKDVTESSLADSKKAAQTIKDAIAKVGEIEAAGTDYEKMGKILGEKCFTEFSDNAYILTKSSALTPDDRVALGTIKRYGVVADAIIMMGGLAEALRAGGIEVAGGGGGYIDQAPIIDSDSDLDDEDTTDKKVNANEVKKYIKLTRGAFQDIDKVGYKFLSSSPFSLR